MTANWTRQRILYELRERGTTAAALAEKSKMQRFTFYSAMERPYPRVHTLIASALGLSRQVIWPQFYGADGQRLLVNRRKAA
jgi:Ner family transcriptional regulator